MKHRTSQILYAYWNEVRADRLAPRRFDIEPARIASILAETMILERIDADTARFRLAGSRIGEQFATDFRGLNFLDLWVGQERTDVAHLLTQMTDHGAVGVLEIEVTGSRRQSANFEVVLLPLVHTRNVIDRFLGAMSCANAPSWLGTERPTSVRLTGTEVIWPEGRPHAVAARMHEPAALSATASMGRLVRNERRQFRVLDGGRT